MGFDIATSIPAATVFIQGLLSFFSPCVLPLVPLYLGYLAGGALRHNEDGSLEYPRKTVLLNTVFFVAGISFAFFVLALGFTALGQFFSSNQRAFSAVAGIIMVLFGLYMLGAFGQVRAVETERRLPFKLDKLAMSPLVALAFGFTFSFAWTPCVGPVLAGVLLMASSSASAASGFALVGVYTLGFVLPFLAVGLFTSEVLRFFRSHKDVVRYTVKVGGALLIVMGIMTTTGWMNNVTSYLSSFGGTENALEQPASDETEGFGGEEGGATEGDYDSNKDDSGASNSTDAVAAPLAELSLVDQYGDEHALADYRGKVVFLNFFATWCGPCVQEIPHIEEAYQHYGCNQNDVVILSVANPSTPEKPNNSDVSSDEVISFAKEQGVNYPVLMDTTGEMLRAYGISAFPTTFMIDAKGEVLGYAPGSLPRDMVFSIIEQTLEASHAD